MKFKGTNPKRWTYLSLHILVKSHFFQSFTKPVFLRENDFPTSYLCLERKLGSLFQNYSLELERREWTNPCQASQQVPGTGVFWEDVCSWSTSDTNPVHMAGGRISQYVDFLEETYGTCLHAHKACYIGEQFHEKELQGMQGKGRVLTPKIQGDPFRMRHCCV